MRRLVQHEIDGVTDLRLTLGGSCSGKGGSCLCQIASLVPRNLPCVATLANR